MLKKIYTELVQIRKELQTIRKLLEPKPNPVVVIQKEYGESAAEELISRSMEASKAEGDLDEIMKGLINDTFDILSKARSNRDNTGKMPQALKEVLRKMLEDTIMH